MTPRESHPFLAVALALVLLTAAVYGQTLHHGFMVLDDGGYVSENPTVRDGLSLVGLVQACGVMAYNWHPLTWLSHMLDVQLFGMRPLGHHLTSVLLHAASAVLLFAVLRRMTGALWRSALVATLFATHPLAVESVAWIAERKNVLCTLLLWLTLGAWVSWLRRPSRLRFAAALTAYALGIMAKPMLVTLPFLLLLLDWWPLGRLLRSGPMAPRQPSVGRLLLEKLPFLALAAMSSALTVAAQAVGIDEIPLTSRVANALVSYSVYLRQMVWPTGLAVLYPYPVDSIPATQVAGAALSLTALTVWIVLQYRRRPYLAVGWFWYLGTLVPVSGLVHVGPQARADRYTYLPIVGIFLALVWLAGQSLPQRWIGHRHALAAAAAAAFVTVAALATTAFFQASRWQDNLTLMSHTARVTKDNYFILNNLGIALTDQRRFEEARSVFEETLRIRPDHANAIYNLGNIYYLQRRWWEAAALYLRALNYEPDRPDTYINLGVSLFEMGRYAEAVENFDRAHVDPAYRLVGAMRDKALFMMRKKALSNSSVGDR